MQAYLIQSNILQLENTKTIILNAADIHSM